MLQIEKDYYGTGIRKYWMSVMPLHVKMRVMAFFSRDNLHLIPPKQIVPLMRIVDFMRGFKDTK